LSNKWKLILETEGILLSKATEASQLSAIIQLKGIVSFYGVKGGYMNNLSEVYFLLTADP
jgi:hypothetical protein